MTPRDLRDRGDVVTFLVAFDDDVELALQLNSSLSSFAVLAGARNLQGDLRRAIPRANGVDRLADCCVGQNGILDGILRRVANSCQPAKTASCARVWQIAFNKRHMTDADRFVQTSLEYCGNGG